ncbi:hypothetical protein IPC1293_31160 [Pseudomonas aeruginosa]|nr:hypothetical protein IPC1293_31160 [Pseudomonas aeruginosa]
MLTIPQQQRQQRTLGVQCELCAFFCVAESEPLIFAPAKNQGVKSREEGARAGSPNRVEGYILQLYLGQH